MPPDPRPPTQPGQPSTVHDDERAEGGHGHPLYDVGEDPDARFTLANERTFLAWIRTSLALVAAGLAVEQLLEFGSHADRLIVALPLMGLGAAAALSSYRHWEQTERAIRLDQALPYSRLPRVLAYGIGVVTIATAVFVTVDALR
jgi:putative membrane protein